MKMILIAVAMLLLNGCVSTPTPEDQKTIDVLSEACNSKHPYNSIKERGEACMHMGNIYLGIDEFKYLTDEEKSYTYYKRGCDLNNAKSCYMVGIQYEEGYGTKLNFIKALKVYKKACKLGLKKGCNQYALLDDPEYIQAKIDSLQSKQVYYGTSSNTQQKSYATDDGYYTNYLAQKKSYSSNEAEKNKDTSFKLNIQE